jgi:flagellin
MISIHSNYVQTRATNQLLRQSLSVNKAAERLTSGKRIRGAADDAAGQAVVTKVKALTRSRRVAQRNIQHARNLCNMAEGGISGIRNNVIKLRQLAVQAASDGIQDKERNFVHKEATELLTSIDKIAMTSKLLEDQPLLYKTPIDIGFIIDVSGSMSGTIGAVKTHISDFTAELQDRGFNVAFGLNLNGRDNADGVDQVADIGSPDFNSELNKVTTNAFTGMDNYSATIESAANDRPGNADPDIFNWRTGSHRYVILVTDTVAHEANFFGDTENDVTTALQNANVTFHGIVNVNGDYDDIASGTGGTLQSLSSGGADAAMEKAMDAIEIAIDEDTESTHSLTFQIGAHAQSEDRIESDLAVDVTRLGLSIDKVDFRTRENAQNAIESLDLALDSLNLNATVVGSLHNSLTRMEVNQGVTIVNEEDARSTIGDADMAAESVIFRLSRVMQERSTQLLRAYSDLQSSAVMNLLEGSFLGGRSLSYA